MRRWSTRMSGCATVLLQEVSVGVRRALCSMWCKHGEDPPVKYREGQNGMTLGMERSSQA